MSEETTAAGDSAAPKKSKYRPTEPTAEQLTELEEKHEDLLFLRGNEKAPWLAVMRRPTRQESLGYKHAQKKESLTANEELLKRIVVFPDPKRGGDWDLMLDKWPFFPDGIAQSSEFKAFIGVSVDTDLKG